MDISASSVSTTSLTVATSSGVASSSAIGGESATTTASGSPATAVSSESSDTATCSVSTDSSASAKSSGNASSGAPTYANTVPTGTFEPSPRTILSRLPSTYDSISTTVLSVSISASLSPRDTASPSPLSHFTTVPSVISAPIAGIVTSCSAIASPNDSLTMRLYLSLAGLSSRLQQPDPRLEERIAQVPCCTATEHLWTRS